ncbi:MAG TPA: DinB family protein [Streptosporangiaceae bacterium]|nr:DinB family protein [Streptosporangiaceae bacterium]
MTISDPKEDLRSYLQRARDAMLWKLDGLSEYDVRRPLTPTGTNLLGLVKHLAGCEIGYFGTTFGRPLADPPPWTDEELLDREPMTDMWATAGESRDYIVGWYRKAWAHADETFDTLALDATGRVPWWPGERGEVNLHRILVHMIAETHRHAGHADIVREYIDGMAGLGSQASNLPTTDQAWWKEYRSTVEREAREAAGSA